MREEKVVEVREIKGNKRRVSWVNDGKGGESEKR